MPTQGVNGLSREKVNEIADLIFKHSKSGLSVDKLEQTLNPLLAPYNIVITRTDPILMSTGAPGGYTGDHVALNTHSLRWMDSATLSKLISHETVHNEQMSRARERGANVPGVIDKILGYYAPGGRVNTKRYYNHPLEQDAYARNAVDAAASKNMDMGKTLRSGKILNYSMSSPTDHKRFLRYANKWAKKLGDVEENLQEYLSNNTSDMSDGTNGGPYPGGSYAGDGGTATGIPDYKSIEREKQAKLKKLIRHRDAGKFSRVEWDPTAQAGLKESAIVIVQELIFD